jgi:hypothetical protein
MNLVLTLLRTPKYGMSAHAAVFVPGPNVPLALKSSVTATEGTPPSGPAPILVQPSSAPPIVPAGSPPSRAASVSGPDELQTVETHTVVPLYSPEPAEPRSSSTKAPHAVPKRRVVTPK